MLDLPAEHLRSGSLRRGPGGLADDGADGAATKGGGDGDDDAV
jgi:hypothetical protein